MAKKVKSAKLLKQELKNLRKSQIIRTPKRVAAIKKQKKRSQAFQPTKVGGMNGISMMSDGVNVGSVWKNTTAERLVVPMAREKVMDLTSTGTSFQTLAQLYLNPGNTQLFPVFAGIAKNYEEYIPTHLKFYYRTEEYMASGTVVSAGLAALGTNFDPDAPNFATMTEMENYEHSISGPPFSGIMVHDVLEQRKRRGNSKGGAGDLALKNYFVHYGPNQEAPGTQPGKFYDIGNFQLCVNGTQAGVIGELWVEYSFTLIRRLQQPGSVAGGALHATSIASTTGDNLAAMAIQSGATLSGVTFGSNVITFPANQPGNYFVSVAVSGATSASGALAIASTTGTPLAVFCGNQARDAGSSQRSLASTTGFFTYVQTLVGVPVAGATITLTPSVITGGGTTEVWIFASPSTVLTVDEREQIEIDNLVERNNSLERRLAVLESLLSRSVSPQIEESKESETDMETSVHIPRSMLTKMLLGQ